MPPLDNPRHERFAQGLAEGKTQKDAYLAAGYKDSRSGACELATKPNIGERVAELLGQRAARTQGATLKAIEKLELSKEWVISRLMENAERSLQRVPVLDAEGKETGEWRYDGTVANRALELLGKHLGILIDRKEIGEPGEFDRMADTELLDGLREEAARLGLAAPDASKTSH